VPQTAYIHPRVAGDKVRYFEWMGAAAYTADHRAGAMHGKQFLLDSVYAGIDATHLYGRLDFMDHIPDEEFDLVVNVESWAVSELRPRRTLRLEASVNGHKLKSWKIDNEGEGRTLASSAKPDDNAKLAMVRNFEFKLPLGWLLATPVTPVAPSPTQKPDQKSDSKMERRPAISVPPTSKLRLRLSLWQNRLPVDSLPLEGWIELQVVSEGELLFGA